MNNIKSSRFDFLNETPCEKNQKPINKNSNKRDNFKEGQNFKEGPNFFKSDYSKRPTESYNKYERYNKYETKESKKNREQYEKMQRDNIARIKEEENKKNLAIDNFPQLGAKGLEQQKQENKISYMDKVNQIPIKENNGDDNIEYIKPGWVEIKRDPENPRKIIYTYGSKTDEEVVNNSSCKTSKTTPEPQVLEALVNLYNKRTQEYIDMWGYDTWEKMYRFPNYDYNYFDRLDEEYEEELEEDEN
jgi:hypothetical protein